MDISQHRKLQSLIRKHVAAQVALSNKGSQDVYDRLLIEEQADEAKKKLYGYMSLLITEVRMK